MPLEADGSITFVEAVDDLLGLVECRTISSIEDREAVFRLRYDAYLREEAISPNVSRMIFDRFDDLSNTWTYGFFLHGQLASSIRISLADSSNPDIPAAMVFNDAIDGILRSNRIILDPTRFVLDAKLARLYPKLLYITLRLAWLATEYFGVDDTLASVRTEHQAFYRRFYGHVLLCPARPYPSLIKPLSLMALDFAAHRSRGLRRYPFLRSSASERSRLFAPWTSVCKAAQTRVASQMAIGGH